LSKRTEPTLDQILPKSLSALPTRQVDRKELQQIERKNE